jgi:hypothetical protein
MIEKIGEFTIEIVNLLKLDIPVGTPIYIGETNKEHIKNHHFGNYIKYARHIPNIIAAPDYVGINPSDGSIQFIKSFGKYVKVAVRVADSGEFYVRSLYSMTDKAVFGYIENGKILPVYRGYSTI